MKNLINKNHHLDCLDLMAKMPDNFVDLVVTSPPYDDMRDYDGYNFDVWATICELYRITKRGGVVAWVVNDSISDFDRSATSFEQAIQFKEAGFKFYECIIWNKGGSSFPSVEKYHQVYEFIFIFSKDTKPKTINLIKDQQRKHPNNTRTTFLGRSKNGKMNARKTFLPQSDNLNRLRDNIWTIYPDKIIGQQHPAVFPERLASDLIYSFSQEGDLVYDPFAGSGTTLRVAKDLKRDYLGSEISPEYCKIIEQRLAQEVIY